jgi:hypothetical protein
VLRCSAQMHEECTASCALLHRRPVPLCTAARALDVCWMPPLNPIMMQPFKTLFCFVERIFSPSPFKLLCLCAGALQLIVLQDLAHSSVIQALEKKNTWPDLGGGPHLLYPVVLHGGGHRGGQSGSALAASGPSQPPPAPPPDPAPREPVTTQTRQQLQVRPARAGGEAAGASLLFACAVLQLLHSIVLQVCFAVLLYSTAAVHIGNIPVHCTDSHTKTQCK